MEFTVECPINSLSFGQCSLAILREFYVRGLKPSIFTIAGQAANLSGQSNVTPDFHQWLETCIGKSFRTHSRKNPVFKLWHLNGALQNFSDRQVLLTFFETDSPTAEELNVVRNNSKVLFTSKYAVNCFKDSGANNVGFVPLGFDRHNFFPKDAPLHEDGRIVFNLLGKLERRKHHAKVIRAWVSKYGNNPKYFLQCALHNPFIPPEEIQATYAQILGGQTIFNIKFFNFMEANDVYNDFLNSCDIIIGMSGSEAWGLPEFHSLALGKHGVFLDAHGYKEYVNDENAVLIKPSGKIPAPDNRFFALNNGWSQGNFFDFKDEEFIAGCEKAIQKVSESKVNWNGAKLQSEFTFAKTADVILEELKKV